jgi:hypothetical protein
LEPVVDQLFRLKPRSTICLWEHALHNIRWNGPIIWTEMTREGFQHCGAEMVEAEGIDVLRVEAGLVAQIDAFLLPQLFPAFGLPPAM